MHLFSIIHFLIFKNIGTVGFKIIHAILVLLFILFAGVQINDPDPLGWILIYLGVSVSIILYMLNKDISIIPLAGGVISIVGMILLIPDFIVWLQEGAPTITGSMKATEPHIELTREFLGFIIAAIAYFSYFYLMYRRTKSC